MVCDVAIEGVRKEIQAVLGLDPRRVNTGAALDESIAFGRAPLRVS
jgi:hypothetical protein